MRAPTLRKLHAVHRWLGALISANLLFLCLTGVILVFRHEIDELLGDAPEAREAAGAPMTTSALLAAARRAEPERAPLMIGWDHEHPESALVLMKSPASDERGIILTLDRETGERTGAADLRKTFTGVVLALHKDLMLGSLGRLYVGVVGLAFFVVLVLGLVLYGPFMKQLAFGALRPGRAMLTVVDVHKALGAATAAWNGVVAGTGVLLALGSWLVLFYLNTELAELRAPPSGNALPAPAVSIDDAIARASAAAPDGMRLQRVALPGHTFSGDAHYMMLYEGEEGLRERLLSVVLIDATTGEAFSRELPWYLQALLISEPLHFGDYGGLPLRLLWALFALVTVALTVSGLFVFAARRRGRRAARGVPT